ncbi:MAG: TonB-dependent receptor, partial [Xanthomonadales bacterium]|nr:TonB-dependent receptor [Xanthomonadales bacterium]
AGLPLQANAQPDPAPQQEGDDNDRAPSKPETLGEVTVTARRRAESAEDVPVAVSAFEASDLVELQASNLDNLQGAVPNLNIVQGRGSANSVNVFIRGIGQPDALQTFDPGVGIYVDDVYYSRINGALFSLFDVARIEVLRGPQGTLYGKNSTGGAIKLVTKDGVTEPESSLEFVAGDYGRLEGRLYSAMPLGDTASISFAAAITDNDGYIEDPVTGKDYNSDGLEAFRTKLSWSPTDSFSASFSLDYTHQDNPLTLGRPEAPLVQVDLALGPQILLLPDAGEYDFETRTSFPRDFGQRLRHRGVSANLQWDLSDSWLLKSITAKRWLNTSSYIDIDASELELGDVLVSVDQDQFSQEFQLQFDNGGDVDAVIGLFYLRENVPSHQEAYADDFLALAGTPIDFLRTIDDDLETTSYALFGQMNWAFAPTWNLALGLRYTKEDKDYARSTSTFSNVLPALNGTFAFTIDDSWNATTPSIAIQKELSEQSMIYASANRGFKSGGFNGRANSAAEVSTFDPETVWTYEGGWKFASADRRLLGSVTVFHSEYKDFQARVSEITNPGAPIPTFSFPVLNAAELSIDGVEFEGTALIGEGTRLSAQVGWLDAQYDEFNDPRIAVDPTLASLHDNVPFSPEWTARLAASHSWFLSSGSMLTLGGDLSYRDDVWLSVDNREVLSQDAYTLFGLYGIWDSPEGNWQVRAGVKNLTDEVYKTDGQEFSSVGNIQTAYYGWPRHFYVAVRYNWF